MNTNDRKFDEQDHPLKNTDHAFVQVGKQGEPVIPKVADEKKTEPSKQDDGREPEKR